MKDILTDSGRSIKAAKLILAAFMLCICILMLGTTAYAAQIPGINFSVSPTEDPEQVVTTLQILFMFSIITLAPSLILMLTCFTRVLICLHFLRAALGTQQMPPNQIIIGLTLFISLFIMGPILTEINENAIQPYSDGRLSQGQAIERGMQPLREFMFRQVEPGHMKLFLDLAGESYELEEDVPNRVLIPAFMLGEITKGFRFGVVVYLPFIAIDMIVASVLMAMGMMMLPPAMISAPFKLMLFVLIDGWTLVIQNLVLTFK